MMFLTFRMLVMGMLGDSHFIPLPVSTQSQLTHLSANAKQTKLFTRRDALILTSLVPPSLNFNQNSILSSSSNAITLQVDEIQREEDRIVQLFQETSPSVVFIEDLELTKVPNNPSQVPPSDDENAEVEGTGSGFIWDEFGHIVTSFHVVAKLATDRSGLQCCKVSLFDARGNNNTREGKIVGCNPDFDLAVLKVNVEGDELKPVALGTSEGLHVGQSCFAIGNPYGYARTLTTGVISGLGREIPSPNGKGIRGVIQTDASINTGNFGGPLIDSHGHVIGVNTATFTRKGTGISSGVNFAIPIDIVIATIPYLIVYGTLYTDRF